MSSAPANFIAPFWDDMDTDTGGTYGQVFGTAPNRVYVVEWYNRPHYSNVGSATFEVLFYEGTNQITFQYQDVDFGNVSYNNGAGATVGIKGSTIQYSFNAARVVRPAGDPVHTDRAAEHRRQPVQPGRHAASRHDDAADADHRQQRRQPAELDGREESTAANGRSFAAGRLGRSWLTATAPVQEIKIGDVGLATARPGVGQQATPQRADTPESLITISHSLSQSIVQNNSASCNGGSPELLSHQQQLPARVRP